jgi:acetate---CoA ligase (ADP-forming)
MDLSETTILPRADGVEPADLDRLFNPRAIAVVGASRDRESLAGRAIVNIAARSGGAAVYPINPSGQDVAGLPSYASLDTIPDGPVDVAYVVVRRDLVPGVIEQCGRRGIPFAVVASSGFGETGPDGRAAEQAMLTSARSAGVRVVGPNTNGLWNPRRALSVGFNISHEDDLPAGNVAVVAQSGALLGSLLRRMVELGAGIASAIATGNETDLDLADYVAYLAEDPTASTIVLLIDALKDTRRFCAAVTTARRAGKDILALKFGQTSAGRRAAELHSSRIGGAPESFRALTDRLGIIDAPDLETLAGAAALLDVRPGGYTDTVTGVSMSGAGASLLADLIDRAGLQLHMFSPEASVKIGSLLDFTAVHNPLDTTGQSADPAWLASLFGAIVADSTNSTVAYLVTLVPEVGRSSNRVLTFADAVADHAALVYAPAPLPAPLRARLREAGVPVFGNGQESVTALKLAAQATRARATAPAGQWWRVEPAASPHLDGASNSGGLVSHDTIRPMLAALGVRFPFEVTVTSAEEARATARARQGQVVAKLLADDLVHKRDAGGVLIGLSGDERVTEAYQALAALGADHSNPRILIQEQVQVNAEFLLGYRFDDQAGPVVLLGFGGSGVEADPDVAFGIAPLGRDDVATMIASLRGHPRLVALDAEYDSIAASLTDAVVAFAELVCRQWPWFDSIEINPLALTAIDGAVTLTALDARATRRPADWEPRPGWAYGWPAGSDWEAGRS